MSFLKKTFILIISSILFFGCSSCKPAELNVDSDTELSNITWDDCSQKIDDHPCDFSLKNQDGESVSLYEFYGNVIVVDFSAMWCGPCNMAAADIQAVQDKYNDQGFTYITVLIENNSGSEPTVDNANGWANTYGIDAPVLISNRDMLDNTGQDGWPLYSWPTFYFITDDMRIHSKLEGYSSHMVEQLIEETFLQ